MLYAIRSAMPIESATQTTPRHDAVFYTLDASEGFSLESVQHSSLQRLVQPSIFTLTRLARAMLYAIRSAMLIESATPTTPQHDAVSYTLDASEGITLENVQHSSLQRLMQPSILMPMRSVRAMLNAIRSAAPTTSPHDAVAAPLVASASAWRTSSPVRSIG